MRVVVYVLNPQLGEYTVYKVVESYEDAIDVLLEALKTHRGAAVEVVEQ